VTPTLNRQGTRGAGDPMRTLPAKADLLASFVCQKQDPIHRAAKPVSDSFIPDHPQTIDTRQPKIQYPTTLHLLV